MPRIEPCAYPATGISIGHRGSFVSARAIRPHRTFSLPMFGPLSQTDVFNTIARTDTDGNFLIVVSVALRNEYFSRFIASSLTATHRSRAGALSSGQQSARALSAVAGRRGG